jgi:hypothetical protein
MFFAQRVLVVLCNWFSTTAECNCCDEFLCEVQTLGSPVFWSEEEMREIEGSNLHNIACESIPTHAHLPVHSS